MADDRKKEKFRRSSLKTDRKREEDGVWVPYESSFELLLSRIGNPRYKQFLLKKSKTNMRRIQRGKIDIQEAEDLIKRAMAQTVILDWRGLYDEKDVEIPFSKEEALLALREDDDFYEEVFAIAQDRELFRNDELEGKAGNLSDASSGGKSGVST